jgi:integrase
MDHRQSGAFLVRWRDERGRKRSRQVATRDEAEAFKREVEGERAARKVLADVPGIPGWDDGGPLVAEESEYALATYLQAVIDRDKTLRQTSRETYAHSLRNHIADTPLGRADIRSITATDVQAFWGALDAGPGALRNVRQLLGKAFSTAYREGLIDANPMQRAAIKAPPKARQTEVVPLTVPEIEALADAASTLRDRVAILLMAYGGLRAGEVGGLRVQDVDVKRCRVNLRQQVSVTRGGKSIAPLKTAAARRTVAVACSIIEEMEAFLAADPPASDGRVFHGPIGEMWGHQNINNQVQRAAKRAGIRAVNAHQLRHTAVSLWIDDGANPVDVQRMVGHSNIQMTLGVYGHLFTHGGQALADSMERRRDAHRNGEGTDERARGHAAK